MGVIDRLGGLPPPLKAVAPPSRNAVAATDAAPDVSFMPDRLDPALVLGRLDAPAREAYEGLAPADQQAVLLAWTAVGAQARVQLAGLLGRGLLGQRDASGGSLAGNLAAIARLTPPADAPYDARAVLSQTLAHLSEPETLEQSNRNTCGATTVQYMLLTGQPAEYARLVAGVMGEGGTVKLQGGGSLDRVADSLARDDSARDDVMRLMQSALMDQGGHLRGRYSNLDDGFHVPAAHGFWQKLKALPNRLVHYLAGLFGGNYGIGETSVKRLMQRVLGQDARTAGDWPLTDFLLPRFLRGDVYDQVARAVAAGRAVPVDILTKDLADRPGSQVETLLDQDALSYPTLMKSHQVLVTRIEGDRVYYRNPYGYQTSMTLAEFRSRLTDAVIPR